MTEAPTARTRPGGGGDLLATWLVGFLVAAGLGLGASALGPQDFWLVFGVFTACSLGPGIALARLFVGRGRQVTLDPRAEENVESRWVEKAASRALLDVVSAAGLLAGAVSLFELDLPGDLALLGVVAFALVDGGLRYALLARRES